MTDYLQVLCQPVTKSRQKFSKLIGTRVNIIPPDLLVLSNVNPSGRLLAIGKACTCPSVSYQE